MKKKFLIIPLIIAAQILSGCGEDKKVVPPPVKKFDLTGAKDGTYTAESSRDEKLGYSKLTLTINGGKITDAKFTGVDLLGNEKNESYGSLLSEGDYKKAQVAVKGIRSYPKQLIETQDLKKVDAISGASISYGQFVETVERAVDEAKK
ncbi:MAG: FMN-binding protein [Selenomonadaceae bacterium]|nr:FMN-binding protein [Selenomonadaceae bacterium]